MSEPVSAVSCQNGRALALPRTRLTFPAVLLLALVTALAVGSETASAWFLDPGGSAGSGGGASTTLYWIALTVAVVIAVVINLALIRALRRGRSDAAESVAPSDDSPRTQRRVGGALALFVTVLFVLGIVFTENSLDVEASDSSADPVQVKATGQQWLWRYDYPNDAYSYFRLTVPVDTEVVLDVVTTDVVHSWNVPGVAGKVDAVPGKTNRIRFRADEEGVYRGASSVLSGQAYAAMRTEVNVVSVADYESFIERQLRDTQAAQDSAAQTYKERRDQ